MTYSITIRKTYQYRLYRCDKRDKYLHRQIDIAALIWNHCVALTRRYYRLTGKLIGEAELKSHIAKLRKHCAAFSNWQQLNAQAVQDVIERLYRAYANFFKKQGGLPHFKKSKKYRSFTLKQNGWKLLEGNKIRLGSHTYKYVKHRPFNGKVKTLTVKRDGMRRLWLFFSVLEVWTVSDEVSTGQIGGFDFGLKTFLTDEQGRIYLHPQFFKQEQQQIVRLSRTLSRKVQESNNRRYAQLALARAHNRIADKRRVFHFRLAHQLCKEYDVLVVEDLNLDGMKRLWGRKVSDLGFGEFIKILQFVAQKRGKQVITIDRFTRTTQVCSQCGHRQAMELRDRVFVCGNPHCSLVLDRDHNAAINILRAGASALGLGDVRPGIPGSPV